LARKVCDVDLDDFMERVRAAEKMAVEGNPAAGALCAALLAESNAILARTVDRLSWSIDELRRKG